MKKKLLITLGCSFTEGEGCYDPALLKQYPVINDYIRGEICNKSLERFHANGWPPRLQKKLNFDKLINLGKRGTGESFQLKRFIEEFSGVDLTKHYDVLVVWLTSPPGRISFYVDGSLHSIITNYSYQDRKSRDFSTAYAELIEDVELDTSLEQACYIKILKEICNGKKYNFYVFPLEGRTQNGLRKLLNIPEDMGDYYRHPPNQSIMPDMSDFKYTSLLNCNHPNEEGYELIAQRMFDIINKHDKLISNHNNLPVELEQEWRGSKSWNLK